MTIVNIEVHKGGPAMKVCELTHLKGLFVKVERLDSLDFPKLKYVTEISLYKESRNRLHLSIVDILV